MWELSKVMHKERISLPELLEAIREQGVLHLYDIGLAMLEANGKISIIRKKQTKKELGISVVSH